MKYLVEYIGHNCMLIGEIEADRAETDRANNLVFYEEGEEGPVGGYHKDRWIRWKRE